jgi:hypothetical protein
MESLHTNLSLIKVTLLGDILVGDKSLILEIDESHPSRFEKLEVELRNEYE